MDKWRKVFYDDEGTKLNYKFPKKLRKDSEYFAAVLQFMDTLIKDLSDNGIEKAFIEIAMEYRELIKDVLTNYYSGDIVLAYTMIERLIKEYKRNGIIFSKLSKSYSFNYYVIENRKWDHFLFYRARVGDISNENKEDVLKHTPFDKISKIGSNRFSIPGQPCLYLGSTSYDCWIEMGRPDDREFNVGCILLKKDYEIINLSTDIWVFLEAMKRLKEQADKEMIFKSYLLSQITSFCIDEDNRNFKSEYVISQLISLACKSNTINGISYISKRVSTNEFGHNICMNLALFIPYEQGVKYSKSMISEMKIGTPINYAYFNKLKRASLNLSFEPLPYELKQGAIAIGDFENQIPYRETDFYDYDKYLRQITLKKYGIEDL
ncbi:MAG: hypothetical protein ACI4GW_04030 [Lachnospiraceae bacterium]